MTLSPSEPNISQVFGLNLHWQECFFKFWQDVLQRIHAHHKELHKFLNGEHYIKRICCISVWYLFSPAGMRFHFWQVVIIRAHIITKIFKNGLMMSTIQRAIRFSISLLLWPLGTTKMCPWIIAPSYFPRITRLTLMLGWFFRILSGYLGQLFPQQYKKWQGQTQSGPSGKFSGPPPPIIYKTPPPLRSDICSFPAGWTWCSPWLGAWLL